MPDYKFLTNMGKASLIGGIIFYAVAVLMKKLGRL